jgi:hypothetical protein
MGSEYGKAQGSWVVDPNTPIASCHKIIDGYNDGDPEVMDLCPSPLSGEFADAPTTLSIFRELGIDHAFDENCQMCEDEKIEVLDEYEAGFVEKWWETVLHAAHVNIPEYEPCGVCGLYGHKVKDHDD